MPISPSKTATIGAAHEHLVWLAVYRNGPTTQEAISRLDSSRQNGLQHGPRDSDPRRAHRRIEERGEHDLFGRPLRGPHRGFDRLGGGGARSLPSHGHRDHRQAGARAVARSRRAIWWAARLGRSTCGPATRSRSQAKTLLRGFGRRPKSCESASTRTMPRHPNGGPRERVVFYAGQNVRELGACVSRRRESNPMMTMILKAHGCSS